DEFRVQLQAELHPNGSDQLALFEQILECAWKSRRARWIEHGVVTDLLSPDSKRCARARFDIACASVVELDHLARYENELRVALRKGMLKLRELHASEHEAKIPEQSQFLTQVQASPGGMAE